MEAVVLAVLVDIIMVATGGITKVTTRVEAEVGAMEEMVMTATAMVSVLAPVSYNYSVFEMWLT